MLLSEVCKSTVTTITQANLLLYHAQQRKTHKLVVQRCSDQDMQFYAWVDAANQNRRDQGIRVGAASKELLKGAVGTVSPIAWHSSRIDRTCRSPGSSETQAAVNGEDVLFYIRYCPLPVGRDDGDRCKPSRSLEDGGYCGWMSGHRLQECVRQAAYRSPYHSGGREEGKHRIAQRQGVTGQHGTCDTLGTFRGPVGQCSH